MSAAIWAMAADTQMTALQTRLQADSNKALGRSLRWLCSLATTMVLKSGILLGVESDLSFPNFLSADDVVRSRITPQGNPRRKKSTMSAGCAAALGLRPSTIGLVYGTGGLAWSRARFIRDFPTSQVMKTRPLRMRGGWVLGAGAESRDCSGLEREARIPLRTVLEKLVVNHAIRCALGKSTFDTHTLRLGLNWHMGRSEADALPFESHGQPFDLKRPTGTSNGQYTLVGQGYPSFNSPYEGSEESGRIQAVSKTPRARRHLLACVFGRELNSTSIPELMQGFGLSDVKRYRRVHQW